MSHICKLMSMKTLFFSSWCKAPIDYNNGDPSFKEIVSSLHYISEGDSATFGFQ